MVKKSVNFLFIRSLIIGVAYICFFLDCTSYPYKEHCLTPTLTKIGEYKPSTSDYDVIVINKNEYDNCFIIGVYEYCSTFPPSFFLKGDLKKQYSLEIDKVKVIARSIGGEAIYSDGYDIQGNIVEYHFKIHRNTVYFKFEILKKNKD